MESGKVRKVKSNRNSNNHFNIPVPTHATELKCLSVHLIDHKRFGNGWSQRRAPRKAVNLLWTKIVRTSIMCDDHWDTFYGSIDDIKMSARKCATLYGITQLSTVRIPNHIFWMKLLSTRRSWPVVMPTLRGPISGIFISAMLNEDIKVYPAHGSTWMWYFHVDQHASQHGIVVQDKLPKILY